MSDMHGVQADTISSAMYNVVNGYNYSYYYDKVVFNEYSYYEIINNKIVIRLILRKNGDTCSNFNVECEIKPLEVVFKENNGTISKENNYISFLSNNNIECHLIYNNEQLVDGLPEGVLNIRYNFYCNKLRYKVIPNKITSYSNKSSFNLQKKMVSYYTNFYLYANKETDIIKNIVIDVPNGINYYNIIIIYNYSYKTYNNISELFEEEFKSSKLEIIIDFNSEILGELISLRYNTIKG